MSYTWAPQVSDVALMLPKLTNDATRTFDSTTYPTDVNVTSIISSICAEVAVLAGDPDLLSDQVTDGPTSSAYASLKGTAARCAVIGCAAEIERNYNKDANSRYARDEFLETRYQEALVALRQGIAEFNTSQQVGGVNDQGVMLGSFPGPDSWLVPPGFEADPQTGLFRVDPSWGIW